MTRHDCPLCQQDGGAVLWRNDLLRVVHVEEPDYPGYTRVIWNQHLAEMTDLDAHQRSQCMEAVWRVESTLRSVLAPDKVNLAQFGNMVPHLHWHIIPRWRGDPRFPEAIWAPAPTPRSDASAAHWVGQRDELSARLPSYHAELVGRLNPSW